MTERFEAIGGTSALRAAVAVLYDRLIADPQLARWFEGIDLHRLKRHQLEFLTATLDGPDSYDGRSIREAHAGLAVSESAFTAMTGHLRAALVDLGLESSHIDALMLQVEGYRSDVVEVAGE